MSVSQNFPDEGASLVLNFAGARKLDPRITFTRSSTGTYMDDNGLIVTAPANSPRFDHSYNGTNFESLGLLIEEQRTNLVLRSQEPATSPWNTIVNNVIGGAGGTGGFTVTNNVTTSPNGTSNASQINSTSFTSGDSIFQDIGSITGTGTYTLSIFVKGGTCNSVTFAAFFTGNSTQGFSFNYNPLTGTVTSGSGIAVPYPNGWYRIYFTVTGTNALNNTIRYQFYTNTTGITYLWGAQLEAGAFPTSYIPTVASTVTRIGDLAYIDLPSNNWYNYSQGSLVFQHSTVPWSSVGTPPGYPAIGFAQTSGNSGNSIQYFFIKGNGNGYYLVRDVGVDQVGISLNGASAAKVGFTYTTNSFILARNGSQVGIDTIGTVPQPIGTLLLGTNNKDVTTNMNACISNVIYYPRALTSTQLQALTR